MNPSLVEARVRLGRVRTLRGDSGSGLRVLTEVRAPADRALVYLARLFEGNALEHQGSLEEAERRYDAAIELLPRAQAAHIARAHARHLRGARPEAADEVRATASDRQVNDDADPWFWYGLGFAWRIPGLVEELRTMVRQ
jgi:tetratricopeptide (TPR) repeat protein